MAVMSTVCQWPGPSTARGHTVTGTFVVAFHKHEVAGPADSRLTLT